MVTLVCSVDCVTVTVTYTELLRLTSFFCVCIIVFCVYVFFFFFQAEDGIRDLVRSRGLGDVYKRQVQVQDERVTG